jgi:hypothetical protein
LVIEHILINCLWTHQWYDVFVEWIEIDIVVGNTMEWQTLKIVKH